MAAAFAVCAVVCMTGQSAPFCSCCAAEGTASKPTVVEVAAFGFVFRTSKARHAVSALLVRELELQGAATSQLQDQKGSTAAGNTVIVGSSRASSLAFPLSNAHCPLVCCLQTTHCLSVTCFCSPRHGRVESRPAVNLSGSC